MDQLREDSYVETSKLMMHVNAMSMVLIPYIYGDDRRFMAGILLAAAAAYATHLALAMRRISLRAYQLKTFVAAYYVITILCIWSGQLAGSSETHQRLMTVGQITLFACYCDRTVHIPGQVALALAQILQLAASRGWQGISANVVVTPLLTALILTFCLVVLENTLKEGLAAQFRGTDAESLVASFRTMLRGLCDADLLLDESLTIVDDHDLLSGLLGRKESLTGQAFADLLLQDTEEQERFQKFIGRPNVSMGTSQASTPPCLRVSLRRRSPFQRVGADLFHVRVPRLYGCAGAYHLMALKLDPDAEVGEEDEQVGPVSSSEASFLRPASFASLDGLDLDGPPSPISDRAKGSFLEALQTFSELSFKVERRVNPRVISMHFNFMRSQADAQSVNRPQVVE
ncbi:unnamed protein product [Symbiodinium natans]|uniref:Uncharacterized protein n=1 Tax=Symbiodinium natans TaxID=878477 RepID=A0A812RF28_9DINO|nr:unnamed protein product [Symbiodinium natans]